MVFPKLKSKVLLSATLAVGLVVAVASTASQGSELTDTAFRAEPISAVSEPSMLNRTLAIGAGAVGGLVIYSIATGDWVWITGTMRLIGMSAPTAARVAAPAARVAGAIPAAARVAGAAPAAARAAGTVPMATSLAGARVAGTIATAGSTMALAWRWIPITTSALAGAFVGNAIYGKD